MDRDAEAQPSLIDQFRGLLKDEGIPDDWEKMDYPAPAQSLEPKTGPKHSSRMVFNVQNQEMKDPKKSLGEKKHLWRESLKQTERNLGLRPRAFYWEDYESLCKPNDSWARQLQIQAIVDKARHNAKFPPAVKLSDPPCWPLEDSPVFISIDVEWYEHDRSKITEVGFAYLDVNDLVATEPWLFAENWRSFIRSRHLRIRDHLHMVNHLYVRGCGDRFGFGASEYVELGDLEDTLASCFRAPYGSFTKANENVSEGTPAGSTSERNIVLVGHDIAADIRLLQHAGVDVKAIPHIRIVDTSELYRSFAHETETRSLAHILSEFGIDAWQLHNAGNDATYTMFAVLAIATHSASKRRVKPIERFWDYGPASARTTNQSNQEQNAEEHQNNEGWDTDRAAAWANDNDADRDNNEPADEDWDNAKDVDDYNDKNANCDNERNTGWDNDWENDNTAGEW